MMTFNQITIPDEFFDHPLLTRDEEKQLAQRIQSGDEDARKQLIYSNHRLVLPIAYRYRGCGIELDDLIQEGIIGLIRATQKYEWQRGNRFSTYAVWWIRHSISRAAHTRNPSMKYRKLRNIINDAEERFRQTTKSNPRETELAAVSGVPIDVMRRVNRFEQLQSHISIDKETKNGVCCRDTLIDDEDTENNALDRIHRSEIQSLVREALTQLDEREYRIICMQYGIGEQPKSEQDIADVFGLSRERIRQLRVNAQQKISDYLNKLKGESE